MYNKNSDNITLTIDEQADSPQGFDNAMYDIREQLQDFDTYYVYSGCLGNFQMVHTFYNFNRDIAYYVTDYDIILAMGGNALNLSAHELDDQERDDILRLFGFDEEEEEEEENFDSLDIEALNDTGEQFAELQQDYQIEVYDY